MNFLQKTYNTIKSWGSRPVYVRNADGSHNYVSVDISDLSKMFEGGSNNNLEIAQNHPILTPALLFVSKLYSQVKFKVVNETSGRELKNHWITKLLNDPNGFQTSSDLQESLLFMQIAQGKAVLYKKKLPGFDRPDSLYLLNSDLITWPKNVKSKLKSKGRVDALKNQYIKYDHNGENLDIKIKDLIFIYDSPNFLKANPFESESRITGLKQALKNTNYSLIAKEIILKTNGTQLISSSGGSGTIPLNPEEQKKLEFGFQASYGLTRRRRRTFFTKANITHKSLHIALRDLGLDESVKVDGNLIYTALHIPKDILSLEAKKTTYNNFKESMVSYIQNEMQSFAESTALSLKKSLAPDENIKIVASYDHLPVMQWYIMQRYEALKKRAEALISLLKTGLPVEECLELCDFDRNTKLDDIWRQANISDNSSNENSNSNSNNDGEETDDTE